MFQATRGTSGVLSEISCRGRKSVVPLKPCSFTWPKSCRIIFVVYFHANKWIINVYKDLELLIITHLVFPLLIPNLTETFGPMVKYLNCHDTQD